MRPWALVLLLLLLLGSWPCGAGTHIACDTYNHVITSSSNKVTTLDLLVEEVVPLTDGSVLGNYYVEGNHFGEAVYHHVENSAVGTLFHEDPAGVNFWVLTYDAGVTYSAAYWVSSNGDPITSATTPQPPGIGIPSITLLN